MPGIVTKLSNHLHEYGATDAMFADKEIFLSSGYDIDSGVGYVNGTSILTSVTNIDAIQNLVLQTVTDVYKHSCVCMCDNLTAIFLVLFF